MNKSTILNKLKLLDIRNPWAVSIVHGLSNRRGASANINPLFRDVRKRLKASRDPNAKKKFNKAITSLTRYGLLLEKDTATGIRLYLFRPVWQLEDAIIDSLSTSTITLSQGRKSSIQWKTILKEVRKELSFHQIKIAPKITKALVFYFLLRRCGWQSDLENQLIPPKKSRRKLTPSPEQQHDLFG